jgi:hypothetical protein
MKDKFIWVLDASSGDVLRFKIPENFPENGDHERLIAEALEADGEYSTWRGSRRLNDSDWMIGGETFQCIGGE